MTTHWESRVIRVPSSVATRVLEPNERRVGVQFLTHDAVASYAPQEVGDASATLGIRVAAGSLGGSPPVLRGAMVSRAWGMFHAAGVELQVFVMEELVDGGDG